MSRAVRWLHALEARLARGDAARPAETAPAEAAPAEAPDGAQAVVAIAGVVKAGDGKAKRQRLRTADDEIRGKSTEAVVARICANLGTAALLLGDAEAARRAAQLAEQARALLNGEPEPAINPRSPEYEVLAPARDAGAARHERAMPGCVAPDTG